jgi:trans-2,3-dihydro-3-hydroxyanthranilate isomerase
MPTHPYITVDVFTERAFAGNPLAVVTDARGLDPEQMQAIAAEFGYPESTFVLPPEEPAHTARVRIFTPRREVPFAGHPNVGTAFVVARLEVRQGVEMGRPSLLSLSAEKRAGAVARVRVGGRCAPVTEGTLEV